MGDRLKRPNSQCPCFSGALPLGGVGGYRGGLVCIDVLSKYAVVVPIRSKNGEDVLEATKEALRKMGKKSKINYTDDERAIAGEDFKDYVEGEGIELYRTRGHPAFAERFIRTYKDMFFLKSGG